MSVSYFKLGSLIEAGVHQFGQTDWPASPKGLSVLPGTGIIGMLPVPGFYVGAGCPNSGTNAWVASPFLIEPSPQNLGVGGGCSVCGCLMKLAVYSRMTLNF